MTIGILGCGWLGFPLAQALVAEGFSVKGSTTSHEKLAILEQAGIDSFLISISEDNIHGDITAFLQNIEILIIDIPPKSRHSESPTFSRKIKTLIPFLENAGIKKVLFVSSISVYADDNSIISETTIPNSDSPSGQQLIMAETLLQNNKAFETTVIRFGGLIGSDRHPVKFLAGKKALENPEAPVNLIHQKDGIGIILKIIEYRKWNEVFNAVAPLHPTRKDYYTQKAREMNLPLPEFATQKRSVGKTISSDKITAVLNYLFVEGNL